MLRIIRIKCLCTAYWGVGNKRWDLVGSCLMAIFKKYGRKQDGRYSNSNFYQLKLCDWIENFKINLMRISAFYSILPRLLLKRLYFGFFIYYKNKVTTLYLMTSIVQSTKTVQICRNYKYFHTWNMYKVYSFHLRKQAMLGETMIAQIQRHYSVIGKIILEK